MLRISHLADWHIGSARGKIDPVTKLNCRLTDFARSAHFCVEDSIARGAQLILHGGDVFNVCRPTPTERRLAIEAFQPALEAGIPVVALLGNHDASRAPAEKHALDLLMDIPGLLVYTPAIP